MPRSCKSSDVLRHAGDALISIGLDRRILSMNPVAEALTGMREAQAVGQVCGDVLRVGVCTAGCPFDRVIQAEQQVTIFDTVLKRADGEEIHVCMNSAVLKNADGDTIGIVEDIRDIRHVLTLMAEREAALAESRRLASQLTALLEGMSEGVVSADAHCRIAGFNRAAENMLGHRREELVGRTCREVFGGDFCPVETTLSSGQPISGSEIVLRARDGSPVPVWLSTALLRDGGGSVTGAVATFADLREVRQLKEQLRDRLGFDTLVGKSAAMQRVYERVQQVAPSDATVLIAGESGTGKELVAAILHARSPRWNQPFVKVNCAALPETLLESELFGHVRGAFTGAIADKPGRFEMANGGTILLDEISDLTPPLQAKLLRALQEREFERVGGTRTIRVDVRVIAATNRDLEQMMGAGTFREDLFYRLSVVPLRLPSLREHSDDIPLLAESFLNRIARRAKQAPKRLTPDALKLLLAYRWPGNVRELENAMEYAAVSTLDDWIRPDALPERLLGETSSCESSLSSSLAFRERELIEQALASSPTLSAAAHRLNISRATLWRKMKRLNVHFRAVS